MKWCTAHTHIIYFISSVRSSEFIFRFPISSIVLSSILQMNPRQQTTLTCTNTHNYLFGRSQGTQVSSMPSSPSADDEVNFVLNKYILAFTVKSTSKSFSFRFIFIRKVRISFWPDMLNASMFLLLLMLLLLSPSTAITKYMELKVERVFCFVFDMLIVSCTTWCEMRAWSMISCNYAKDAHPYFTHKVRQLMS